MFISHDFGPAPGPRLNSVYVDPKVLKGRLSVDIAELLRIGDGLQDLRQSLRCLNTIHRWRLERTCCGILKPESSEKRHDMIVAQSRSRIVEVRNTDDHSPHRGFSFLGHLPALA